MSQPFLVPVPPTAMWLDDNDSSSADDKDYDSTVSDEWKQVCV